MNIEVLDHHTPSGIIYPATDIPDFLKTRLSSWTKNTFSKHTFGIVIKQEYLSRLFNLHIFTCVREMPVTVQVKIDVPELGIIVFPEGTIASVNPGGPEIEFRSPSLNVAYIPAGIHPVVMKSTLIEALVITLNREHMRDLTSGWHQMEVLFEMIETNNTNGVVTASAKLTGEIEEEVNIMRSIELEGEQLYAELILRINKIVTHYIKLLSGQKLPKTSIVPNQKRLKDLHTRIKTNANFHDHDIPELSRIYNISARTLSRNFKRLFGYSLRYYINKIRMEKAETLIKYTEIPIEQVSAILRYEDHEQFVMSYASRFRISPRKIRKQQER